MLRLAILFALFGAGAGALAQAPARRAALLELVRQDCGSCHGLTMKGGLGPALDPAAMAEKDPEQMRHVILYGRHRTPMPPWREHLSEAEAGWIVEQLKRGLPQ